MYFMRQPRLPCATCRGPRSLGTFRKRSASDLLTDIRMTLAANELKRSSLSTGAVAEAVGYQSEAAFQRAFKGHIGVTPAQWRKMQEPSGRDVFARPAADAKTAKTAEADPTDERRPARGGDAPSLAER